MQANKWQTWLYSDWGFSVLFHLLLLVLLVASVGFSIDSKPLEIPVEAQPIVINASFVSPKVTQARYDEQQRQQRLKQASKQRAQEARRKAEKNKKAQEAKRKAEQRELERKAVEAAKRKREKAERREQERLQNEKEARTKAEAEAKRKAERAKADEALQEALAAEQAKIKKAEQQKVLSEKQRYAALIKATIQRNLITNDAFRGKSCRLNIRLGIGGVVLKVDVLSGDDALCRAAITAVYKPSNLPVSRDPAVFAELKNINLTVEQ
ncbi:MAG: cell envelope integrity protein TolA [Alteromonadaceae bacterium]|nr:cell envelope integrity protein TolA [Alteromonadaceae bacterium]